MAEEGLKREYRIDSSDSARPAATLDSETYAYAQGLKPKPRIIVNVAFEELDTTIFRGKDLPEAKMILKTVTYDDGVMVDTTVGEDNLQYQQYLLGIKKNEGKKTSTRVHTPKAKVARTPEKPTKGKG